MYRLEYVKKRKRRRLVALIGGISTVAVATFVIVAFLGRFVGTFTVSLETRNVDLTLTEKKDSTNYSSFLRVNDLPAFQEYTYQYLEDNVGHDVIDSEDTDMYLGANRDTSGNVTSINFFKYTYYVKNIGAVGARYDWSVNILEDVKSRDGRSLLDTLRVMIYVDGVKTIYGQALTTPHDDDPTDYSAPVSVDKDQETERFKFYGYAVPFISSKAITTFQGQPIGVGECKRYTIVAWLEGFRSSNTEFAPRGAKIKLGVEINAYENE